MEGEDETETTVKRRLMGYEDQTQPLIAYYKTEADFHEIDGGQAPDVVAAAIVAVVDQVATAAGSGS